ncbi:MAG: S8 family peptidase, partial [Acidimicrobiales bacterium]
MTAGKPGLGTRPGRSVAWMRRLVPATLAAAAPGVAFAAAPTLGVVSHLGASASQHANTARYIVQGSSSAASMRWLASQHEHGTLLPGVRGAVAQLSSSQVSKAERQGFSVTSDQSMHLSGTITTACNGVAFPAGSHPSDAFLGVTGATSEFADGDYGQGVTVAVLDTGIDALPDFQGRLLPGVDLSGGRNADQDAYGHGTFVAGLIAGNGASSGGQYTGEAPEANLLPIKVAGASGSTSEGAVIEGIEWAIAHRNADNIRVLNISLGVLPSEPSWDDPVDEAVEQAWRAGIVVVTSAGNSGPSSGTITSPGDDPLVITVGALDDGGGTNPADYSIASFSSVGPTLYDGVFKPDLVAPGRSVISLKAPGSTIADENPDACIGTSNFVGSGTSFSAAIVSGMVALILEQHPYMTPDQVKAALLAGTTAGPVSNPFLDGHGIANATGAISAAGAGLSLNQVPAEVSEKTTGAGGTGVISLAGTWGASTFNSANWNGAEWNGAEWNGAEWNGAEWNGA